MDNRRQTIESLMHKNGILTAKIDDAAFNGGTEENTSDEVGAKDIPVLMPPGLTVDFPKGAKHKVSAFVKENAGTDIFLVNPNLRTQEDDEEAKLEDSNGTTVYFLQKPSIKMVLNDDNILITKNENTSITIKDGDITIAVDGAEIIMKDNEPISIEANGVSLGATISDFLNKLSSAKTFGSPVSHSFTPDFVVELKQLDEKFGKVLKK